MSWESDLNKMSEEKNILIKKKFKLIGIFILFTILIFLSLSLTSAASSYVRSAPAYTFGQQIAPYTGGQLFPTFDTSLCQAGQDFILQVDPLGCTPSIVRSDLLEEQEVVVFCPISATQLNPMIEIKDIDYLIINSKDLPKEVLTVGYYPARAALGKWNPDITTPYFGNIGYATVVLRRQVNESAMPDFVEGNMTAKLVYDIDNAYGTGRSIYYLPQLSEDDWNRDYVAYGFWDGRGYLRLEGSDNKGATIGVYSDRDISGTKRVGEKTKIATLNLEKGGTSQEIFLRGFNFCMGGLKLQLNDLENPDTRARLRIDSEVIEVARGEKFLENKCEITEEIIKQGVNQKVKISCQEDEKRSSFPLTISPTVSLSIGETKKEYGVGDRLYSDDKISVYLGFIGNSGTSNSAKDLYIRLISIPTSQGTAPRLTESELSYTSDYDKCLKGSDIKKGVSGLTDITNIDFSNCLKILPQAVANLLQKQGRELYYLHTSAPADTVLFGNNKIDILGYSGVYDADLSQMPADVTNNYVKAKEDYEMIKGSLSEEKYPPNSVKTLGEQALFNAITLAESLDQRSTALQLCKDFLEYYGSVAPSTCNYEYLLSNTQTSSQSVVINGRTHLISFEGVREPSPEEFGLKILVSSPDGSSVSHQLSKNERIYLGNSNTEYIQLTGLEEDSATLTTNLKTSSFVGTTEIKTSTQKLKSGVIETFGSSYSFSIQEIKLQKVAKVSINPQVDYARTNTTISFKIGIEKRGIKLSPEKTRERIQTLNKTIEKMTKISNGLGKVVSAEKAACLATEATLMIKNLFLNMGGKGIARQIVMKAKGVGWYDKCHEEMKKDPIKYDSLEACLLDKAPEIEASVNAYKAPMDQQNQEIKQLEEGVSKTTWYGEKQVNTDKLTDVLIKGSQFTEDIRSCTGSINQIRIGERDVNVAEKIVPQITLNTTSLIQARSLQLNCRLLGSSDDTVKAIARSQVEKTFGEIYSNSRTEARIKDLQDQYKIPVVVGATQNLKTISITDTGKFSQSAFASDSRISPDANVIIFEDQADAKSYILVLDTKYVITNIYLIESGNLKLIDNQPNPLKLAVKKYDAASYQNKYTNPEVRYYETAPYQGFPSVVPFDIKNGWYAAVKSTTPISGGTSYAASAKVSSFYVCNVGQDGREQNIGGDDDCRGFVPGAAQPPDFPGLDKTESQKKMQQAEDAIRQAQSAYKAGVSKITVNGQRINVGKPAANIPDIQCEDFMSPTDCNILFNVCDPVICPSSRCDLGGAYPVKDVIQSGIGGSLALCLPNWPQIKVPICISGVHAGLEGYLSVLSSYQQCLQTSLDTGQTVGICDELNSIYMCEFFWKQGIPLIKYAIPKVIGSVLGQNVRGGGEYLGFADALSNAEKSIDYFSQYYAANSFKAFKARSVEGVGEEICKNWVSLTGPKGNLFEALISPDSPPQFYGRFEEISYTTATTPPASQYKVFYHIYAGKDLPAYYQVYLRGTISSYYQDTSSMRPVAAGFIKAGDFKSETKDFTAPSGYKELCIVVNGQEVCGFKQVTTEFGINYLSEQYLKQQASQTDITSETECVSGSPSTYSLLNLNIQAGVEETLNPAIYNRGIIRVCSTDNPGKTSDPAAGTANSRWKKVGYCDSQNMGCWLDTDSVKNVIKNANIENQTLGSVEAVQKYVDTLMQPGQYISDFDSFTQRIDKLVGQHSAIIELINNEAGKNIGKAPYNNQKGYLRLIRGDAYSSLAAAGYKTEKDKKKISTTAATSRQCEDCTNLYGSCDDALCISHGQNIGKDCVYDSNTKLCTERTTTIPPTATAEACLDMKGCQKILGEKVMELARQKKTNDAKFSDSVVQQNTGAESFECLALQVALIESSIRHCINSQENGNPLYCNGIPSSVLGGDTDSGGSFGIMQINKPMHPAAFPSVYNFDTNVNYGLDLLINGYNSGSLNYRCYMPGGYRSTVPLASANSFFNIVSYSGWKAALRSYNGWNSNCYDMTTGAVIGNPNYVDAVINAKTEVARLFPAECGD